MTIFDKQNKFSEIAADQLFKNLVERDSKAFFDMTTFKIFGQEQLFKNIFQTQPTDLKVLLNYYNIARSSLDLPFTSSLAAHGFVACHVLKKFGSKEQIARYQDEFEGGLKIASISNSESGTSINLKKMQARLVKQDTHFQLEFH
jgi:alkylation response protein AidB-like acyl-CoA dehydrogenase